jgi:hypothetical protein
MPQPPVVVVNPITKTCTPDEVHINQQHGQGVAIFFTIDPAAARNWSWSQSPDPIVLDDAGSIFSDGKHPGNSRGKDKVRVLNRNLPSDVGSHKYTANLVQDGTGARVAIDPHIINEL